jgi:hypothetical protein
VPFLRVRNQNKLISLLRNIRRLDLFIDWNQIIDYQYKCLKNVTVNLSPSSQTGAPVA